MFEILIFGYQSGETDRNGRISKRGPSLVRTLLVQAAWSAVRHSEWAKNVYERISGKQKTRKKKAAIALARKIAVVAWALLRDETNWDPKVMDRVKILGKKRPTETWGQPQTPGFIALNKKQANEGTTLPCNSHGTMASYDATGALNCARIYETTRPISDGP